MFFIISTLVIFTLGLITFLLLLIFGVSFDKFFYLLLVLYIYFIFVSLYILKRIFFTKDVIKNNPEPKPKESNQEKSDEESSNDEPVIITRYRIVTQEEKDKKEAEEEDLEKAKRKSDAKAKADKAALEEALAFARVEKEEKDKVEAKKKAKAEALAAAKANRINQPEVNMSEISFNENNHSNIILPKSDIRVIPRSDPDEKRVYNITRKNDIISFEKEGIVYLKINIQNTSGRSNQCLYYSIANNLYSELNNEENAKKIYDIIMDKNNFNLFSQEVLINLIESDNLPNKNDLYNIIRTKFMEGRMGDASLTTIISQIMRRTVIILHLHEENLNKGYFTIFNSDGKIDIINIKDMTDNNIGKLLNNSNTIKIFHSREHFESFSIIECSL